MNKIRVNALIIDLSPKRLVNADETADMIVPPVVFKYERLPVTTSLMPTNFGVAKS